VSAALFGFLGVVLGGGITWGIEIWRATRGDWDERRVAARLVAAELSSISTVRQGLDQIEPEFRLQRELALRQDAWFAYRAVLAREMDDEDWLAIRSAYDALATQYNPANTAGETFVAQTYKEALTALKPLATRDRRYLTQRLTHWISRQPAPPTS
jgi:hypothetical protein